MLGALEQAVRRNAIRGGALGSLLLVTGVLLLLLASGMPLSTLQSNAATPIPSGTLLPSLLITDGTNLSTRLGVVLFHLADTVLPLTSTPDQRAYQVSLRAPVADKVLPLVVETDPMLEWSNPLQMPGGPDNLPPFSDWQWTVTTGNGVNDTANWTVMRWTDNLERIVTWGNATYTVTGAVHPVVPVSVSFPVPNATASPGIGLVLGYPFGGNASLPTYSAQYLPWVRSLHPALIRIILASLHTEAYWNSVKMAPVFNFTAFDQAVEFAQSAGASVLLSIPLGTWGDGNQLPKGTPTNPTIPVTLDGSSGWFITGAALKEMLTVVIQHVQATGESVKYWSIGNENPLPNVTVENQFTRLFNLAENTIRTSLPNDLVGSDVMTNRTFLTTFAQTAHNVGFLSYHFYPAVGACDMNGTYCPPAGNGRGTTDATLLKPYAQITDNGAWFAPALAQEMWYNITGRTLPIFDAETNLNAVGGPFTGGTGTDPRDQTLFGAAWLTSTMITGATQDVSLLTYFRATGHPADTSSTSYAAGGWGFNLVAPIPGTNRVTQYAPWWALHLWARTVPAGSVGAAIPTSAPTVVQAYEASGPAGYTLVLTSLVGVRVQVPIAIPSGAFAAKRLNVLDQNSYVEVYNTATDTEQLLKSGVTQTFPTTGPLTVTLDGYGVATVHFIRLTGHAPAHLAPAFTPQESTGVGTTGTVGGTGSTAPANVAGLLPTPAARVEFRRGAGASRRLA
jgi:hypothetical protein